MKKMIPVIVITWVLSLITTLALVYVGPTIFPIQTGQISDSAIITTKLADGSVTSAKILDGTLTAIDIADGSIISVKIADGNITTEKIADGAITTDNIADNAVVQIKLGDNSVTTAKILDGTITTADLANGAVTTITIADGAVTNTKLAAGAIPYAVTSSNDSVTTDSITYTDMPDMTVNITLQRASTVVVMFSAEAYVYPPSNFLAIKAFANQIELEPKTTYIQLASSNITWGECKGFNFYANLGAGFYTIKIQWRTYNAGSDGLVAERTLIAFALPA